MKKKMTPKQEYYRSIFDALSYISMKKRFPKKLQEPLDKIANYVGDIAHGRKK